VCVKLWYVSLCVKFVYVKLLYVNLCVCVKLLYVKFVCVKFVCEFVCVKLLYVKFVCVCEVIVCECVCGRRREEEEAPGIQNQKQEPHTKMWGKIPNPNRKVSYESYICLFRSNGLESQGCGSLKTQKGQGQAGGQHMH